MTLRSHPTGSFIPHGSRNSFMMRTMKRPFLHLTKPKNEVESGTSVSLCAFTDRRYGVIFRLERTPTVQRTILDIQKTHLA